MKYSEFLRTVAKHVVTQRELFTSSTRPDKGFRYSSWICNAIVDTEDNKPYAKKLRRTIRKKIEAKDGKGSPNTFTGLFIHTYDPELNKQFRINWLLKLAKHYESKGN